MPLPLKNHECRSSARLPHESGIKVKAISGSIFHKGRLGNYSKNGVYFETDARFETGNEIFIAIEDSPFDDVDKSGHDTYHGIIRHCTEVDSHFRYGYGVELMYRLRAAPVRTLYTQVFSPGPSDLEDGRYIRVVIYKRRTRRSHLKPSHSPRAPTRPPSRSLLNLTTITCAWDRPEFACHLK